MGIKTRSLCRLGRGILPVLAKVGAILGLRSSKTEDADDSSGRYPRGGQYRHWLKGGADRKGIFPKFCSSHRIFRHPDQANRISIVCENVDLAKLKATMDRAEAKALNCEAHRDRAN